MAVKHTFVSGKSDGADTTLVRPSNWNADHTIDNATITRLMEAADARGWAFLGSATGAATTVGPVTWSAAYQQLEVTYFIAGYNGGTPVGRLLVGTASISTTTATNGNRLREGTTENTTSVSVPGMPLATTLSSIPRSGTVRIDGASGALKRFRAVGQNGAPSVTVGQTLFDGTSGFSDGGTNLLLLRAQLTVYDTLTATAVSAQAFTAGTYLMVLGRNTD